MLLTLALRKLKCHIGEPGFTMRWNDIVFLRTEPCDKNCHHVEESDARKGQEQHDRD